MSSNPYSAPNSATVANDNWQSGDGANISSLTAMSGSLVFSIPCGILAGIAWGSGALANRMSGTAAELLIGLCLGISLLATRTFILGDFGAHKWYCHLGLLLGCGLSAASIHFLYAIFRAAGLHLIYTTMPWGFALLNSLPIIFSTACVSLSIWMTRLTAGRQACWLMLFSAPISFVVWGAIDDILLANKARISHYGLRMILLTIWFVFTTGFVVFCRSGGQKAKSAQCVSR